MIKKIKSKIAQDNHFSDLINSSIISFSLRILGIGLGYLFILLISRNFGAATLGVFTLSFTLLQIISVFGRFGLDTALLRFVAEFSSQSKMGEAVDTYIKAFKFSFSVSVLLSILTYYSASFIANIIFDNNNLEWSFKITALGIVPFTITYLNFETLRALKMIRAYAFFQNVSIFLFSTLALYIMIITMLKTNISVISIFIGAVWITGFISQYKIVQVFKGYTTISELPLETILKTAFPMMVASSLMLIMGWTDTIMIGMFMNESSVGIYNVALKIATLTSITLIAINSIGAPKFAEFYAKRDIVGLQRIVNQINRLVFWTSLPILLISVLFPEFILSIFGNEFKIAAWSLIILCIGQFINAASGSVGYILQMTGHQIIFQKIMLTSLLLNIVLNYILIPQYEITGAAFASMTSLIFWNLASLMYIHSKLKITTFYIPFTKRIS